MDRWRALGGKVGLSEWDIKVWEEPSLPTPTLSSGSLVSIDANAKAMIREDSKRLSFVDCL